MKNSANPAVTAKSFVKQFVALVQGDSDEATAQKVFRQAQSALNTQIAMMTGDLIAKEEALEDAKEKYVRAKLNNGEELPSEKRTSYVQNLVKSWNAIKEAEEALDDHKETLEFLKKELKELESAA